MSLTSTEALCVDCNLCCDGSLFSSVTVTPAEEKNLRLVLNLEQQSGGLFRQPQRCVQLGDTGMCGCYAQRPAKCQEYECDLLKAVDAGLVHIDDAHVITQDAKWASMMTAQAFRLAIPDDPLDDAIVGGLEAGVTHMARIKGTDMQDMDETLGSVWQSYVTYIRAHFRADFGTELNS